MADEEDDDLLALRAAVLASMKSKPKPPPRPKEDEIDLDALRSAALRTKKPDNVEAITAYNHPVAPAQPVETVTALSRSPHQHSPYRDQPGYHSPYRDQPGSPNRPNFHQLGSNFHQPRRGGFGPRNGPPFHPRNGPPFQPRNGPPFQPRNGPPFQPRNSAPFNPQSRNAGPFNATPRAGNLIVLTSEPAKPPEVQVVPAIMVRPQDKWSGSGVVVAPAKPKKPKGPARFSRLESDSDSDEDDDTDADSEREASSASTSSSESEDDEKDEKKDGSDAEGESLSRKETAVQEQSSPLSPTDKKPEDSEVVKAASVEEKETVTLSSDRSSEVNVHSHDKDKAPGRAAQDIASKMDIPDDKESMTDVPVDAKTTRPDYTRVPPPAPSPAASPRRVSPSPSRDTKQYNRPSPLVDSARLEKRQSPMTDTLSKSSPVERQSVHSRLGNRQSIPEKQTTAAKEERKKPADKDIKPVAKSDAREDPAVLEARRRKFANLAQKPAERSSKSSPPKVETKERHDSKSVVSDKKTSNDDKSSKESKVTETKVNGRSGARKNSRASRSRSSERSMSSVSSNASESESDSSTSYAFNHSDDSDSDEGRRDKYKTVERGKDDIERERRQRMAREREERRAQRRSRDGRGPVERERGDRLNAPRDRDRDRRPRPDPGRSSRNYDRQTQREPQEPRGFKPRDNKLHPKEETVHRGSSRIVPGRDDKRANRDSRSQPSQDRQDKRISGQDKRISEQDKRISGQDKRISDRSVRSDSASRPPSTVRGRPEQDRSERPKPAHTKRPHVETDSESDLSCDSPPPKLRSVTKVVDAREDLASSSRRAKTTQQRDKRDRDSRSRGRDEPAGQKDDVRPHRKEEGAKPTRIIIEDQSRGKKRDAREIICRLKKDNPDESPEREKEKQTKLSPKINITFNKEPEIEGKSSTKSRLSVHERLGMPVKQKGQPEVIDDEPKVTRRVITEDPGDARHKLKDKKKDRIVTEDVGDARQRLKEKKRERVITEDPPEARRQLKEKKKSRERKISITEPQSNEEIVSEKASKSKKGSNKRKDYGIWSSHPVVEDHDSDNYDMEVPPRPRLEDRLGRQRPQHSPQSSPTASPERNAEDIRSRLNKKRKKRSLEDRLGVQSVVATSSGAGSTAGDEGGRRKKPHLVWSTHAEPDEQRDEAPQRKRSKTTEEPQPGKKGGSTEDELTAKIEVIRKRNAEIERRRREVEHDKQRSDFR